MGKSGAFAYFSISAGQIIPLCNLCTVIPHTGRYSRYFGQKTISQLPLFHSEGYSCPAPDLFLNILFALKPQIKVDLQDYFKSGFQRYIGIYSKEIHFKYGS